MTKETKTAIRFNFTFSQTRVWSHHSNIKSYLSPKLNSPHDNTMQDQHILFILEENTVVGSTRKFYTKITLKFMVLVWHKGWNFFPGIESSWRVAEKETWLLWQERPFVCGYWGSGSWPGSWPIQVNPWCKLYEKYNMYIYLLISATCSRNSSEKSGPR